MLKQVVVLLVLGLLEAQAISWRNCDSNSPVQATSLYLRPDPVVLRAGTNLTLGGQVRVNGDVGANYTAHVTVQKKVWFFFLPIYMKIPCLKNIGSCTYGGIQCKHVKKWINTCPLPHGITNLNQQIVKIPNLPLFIMKGEYKVVVDLRQAEEPHKRVACLEMKLTI